MKNQMKECTIIVFGDIGRSPRMKNHALQIVNTTNFKVNFLGYLENQPDPKFFNHPNINIIDINSKLVNVLKKLPKAFYLIYALVRIIIQILLLLYIMFFKLGRQEFILVQNPPSIPILSTVYFVKIFKRTRFIIDFHNYGFTILQLSIKKKIIIKLARLYEQFFGRRCDAAFCVSKNMQSDLYKNWGIKAQVLYDKANTDEFKPFESLDIKHEFLKKINLQWNQNDSQGFDETLFTENNKQVQYKDNRPILIISSTSWTQDEDFGIMIDALELYEEYAHQNPGMSRIFACITGKGPQKEYYKTIIKKKQLNWQFIRIQLLWLEPEDYPKLLASCDIGVCLHYSSSGVDLPMKVVDMFGAGIPVLAKKFKAIDELVDNYQNGILFGNAHELFESIIMVFRKFPKDTNQLNEMRDKVLKFRALTFEKEWREKAYPLLINQKYK